MRDKLIFIHLPKCGGTTFHDILERLYSPEQLMQLETVGNFQLNLDKLRALSDHEKEKIKVFKGHLEFGLHQHLPGEWDYITFLRNPIDRIISYYYYLKRETNHRLYELKLFHEDMSLFDFVSTLKQGDIHNGQIRFLSGIRDTEALMLEKALENIEKHFSFVGTIEQFDESLLVLQRMYNWSSPYYKVQNKTSQKPKREAIDAKTLEAIKHFNAGDIALYEKMNKHLQARLLDDPLPVFEGHKLKIRSKLYALKNAWRPR